MTMFTVELTKLWMISISVFAVQMSASFLRFAISLTAKPFNKLAITMASKRMNNNENMYPNFVSFVSYGRLESSCSPVYIPIVFTKDSHMSSKNGNWGLTSSGLL